MELAKLILNREFDFLIKSGRAFPRTKKTTHWPPRLLSAATRKGFFAPLSMAEASFIFVRRKKITATIRTAAEIETIKGRIMVFPQLVGKN